MLKWKRRAMLTPCFVATFYTAPSHFLYSQFQGENEPSGIISSKSDCVEICLEDLKEDFSKTNGRIFGPRYFFGNGTTYFLNVYARF